MNIIIEKAAVSDAAAILEFLKTVGSETDNLSFGAEGLPFSVEDEEKFILSLESSPDGILLVAKDGDRIVGDASLNRFPRRMSHRGELGVSVVKEYWNQGIGGRLIAKIIEFARENSFEIIDLEVRSDNKGAIHLYEKMGFKKIGAHPECMKVNREYISCDYMRLILK